MAVIPCGKLADAALVAHGVVALLLRLVRRFRALVLDGDVQARVQKRLLAHPRMERLIVVLQRVKHLAIGLEGDLRAVLIGRADDAHFLGNMAARELHLINLAVAADLDLEPFGQRVDDRRADAVQAAGDLVASAAELAARVQDGIDDLERGLAGLLLDIDRNTAAVVRDGDGVAGVDGHADVLAVAGQRLVHGIVHDLIHQMVQTGNAGRADVHARSLADGLKALEHLDLTGVILRFHDVISDFFTHRETPLHEKRCLLTPPPCAFAARRRWLGSDRCAARRIPASERRISAVRPPRPRPARFFRLAREIPASAPTMMYCPSQIRRSRRCPGRKNPTQWGCT